MEGQGARDIGWWHGHLEGAPGLPTVLCAVVCGSTGEHESLDQRCQHGAQLYVLKTERGGRRVGGMWIGNRMAAEALEMGILYA